MRKVNQDIILFCLLRSAISVLSALKSGNSLQWGTAQYAFSVASLLHQSSCLAHESLFVFRLLPAVSDRVKGNAPRERERVGRVWEQAEVLLFCVFCTVTGTEADILWALVFLNCGRKRQTESAVGWRKGKEDRWGIRTDERTAIEESFYRFTILLLLTCRCWGKMQTVCRAHLSLFSV